MFIAANWKMNLDKSSIEDFSNGLKNFELNNKIKLCIFPPTIYISYLYSLIQTLPIYIGGQNCHYKDFGAFTGEVSSISLKDSGCKYVILGHSERRKNNLESNVFIKKCAQTAIKAGLIPIICVGENLDQRQNGSALDFIKQQVEESTPEKFDNIYIAYEPIWSIGTGVIPTSLEINEAHTQIKNILSKSSKNVKVLYGGSVVYSNAKQILSVNSVDGLLIGGASLNIKDFLAIYSSAVKQLDINL